MILNRALCSAVGAPMVRSVMDMSLSIDPTSPTMRRCACFLAFSGVIFPALVVSVWWFLGLSWLSHKGEEGGRNEDSVWREVNWDEGHSP